MSAHEAPEERKPTREEKASLVADVLDGEMRWEYRIRHRRKGWRETSSSTQIIQTLKAAHRFAWKLQDPAPGKGELTELVVEKRLTGPWQHEFTFIEREGGDRS